MQIKQSCNKKTIAWKTSLVFPKNANEINFPFQEFPAKDSSKQQEGHFQYRRWAHVLYTYWRRLWGKRKKAIGFQLFRWMTGKTDEFVSLFQNDRAALIDEKIIDGHVIPKQVLFTTPTKKDVPFQTLANSDNIRVLISFTQEQSDSVITSEYFLKLSYC